MFHPEVVHTPDGGKLLANFVTRIAGIRPDWTMAAYRRKCREDLRVSRRGRGSSAAFRAASIPLLRRCLFTEAIVDQLTCVFVDHGLLRQGEAEEVVAMFRGQYNIPLVHADASRLFLDALAGVTDPETKRKTIGRLFIEVFDEEARRSRQMARARSSISLKARFTRM